MKKSSYIPVLIFITAIILLGLSDMVESFSLHVMLGATGKIFLIVGILGVWTLTLIPLLTKNNKKDKK